MSETTTDLDIICNYPHMFTWGLVREIHTIGAITVVEATPTGGGGREYHVYLDGKDLRCFTHSLYSAIIAGIAAKTGEPLAAKYACKVLGL